MENYYIDVSFKKNVFTHLCTLLSLSSSPCLEYDNPWSLGGRSASDFFQAQGDTPRLGASKLLGHRGKRRVVYVPRRPWGFWGIKEQSIVGQGGSKYYRNVLVGLEDGLGFCKIKL